MKVTICYFAVLRNRRGLSEETVLLQASTVRELVDLLIVQHQLDLPSALIRVAVNGDFVDDGYILANGDTVVLIPPVAGG